MDYAHTDFSDEYFELIYAQGSISVYERKYILKEFKRILAAKGIICAGEIVSLSEPVPSFVKDIWERSNIEPILSSAIKSFYESKGFSVISEQELSSTLKEYYGKVQLEVSSISKEEKESNKKYYSRIKHEANAYLRHGGNKYIGFKSLIVRKLN
jgi:ubiquinone/menaquinone biosynthesis C-methylase UbiE